MKREKGTQVPAQAEGAVPDAGTRSRLWQRPQALVNLNEVMRQVLKDAVANPKMIVRVDSLPLAEGDASELQQAFGNLLSTITTQVPADGKLYLYIKCSTAAAAPEGLLLKGFTQCIVRFQASIKAGPLWLQQQSSLLNTVRVQLAVYQIKLECFPANDTGCLFLLTLPGKLI